MPDATPVVRFGDSGGPGLVVVDGVEVLAGVVSSGDASCTGSALGRVDMDTAFIDQWIAQFDPGFDAGLGPDSAEDSAEGSVPFAIEASDDWLPPDSDGGESTETSAGDAQSDSGPVGPAPSGSGCALTRRSGGTSLSIVAGLLLGVLWRRRTARP